MSPIPLFDLLARRRSRDSAETAEMGALLVQDALDDFERLREYERRLSATEPAPEGDHPDPEVVRSIWTSYANWADEAQGVVNRVRPLIESGHSVPRLAELEDA